MIQFSSYSHEGCEIVEKFLCIYELKYRRRYNPKGDFAIYFVYVDDEKLSNLIIEALEIYAKIKEREREIKINERSR